MEDLPERLISLVHSDQFFSCVGCVKLGVFLAMNVQIKAYIMKSYNSPCICFSVIGFLSRFLRQVEVY